MAGGFNVRSITSGFRSPFEFLYHGRAKHPCLAAADHGWSALPNPSRAARDAPPPQQKGGPEAPSSDCFRGRDSPKWGLTGKKCYGSTAVSKSAGDGSTPSFPANLTEEIRGQNRRDAISGGRGVSTDRRMRCHRIPTKQRGRPQAPSSLSHVTVPPCPRDPRGVSRRA